MSLEKIGACQKKQKQKDDNQVILLQYNSYDPEMNTRNQDFSK